MINVEALRRDPDLPDLLNLSDGDRILWKPNQRLRDAGVVSGTTLRAVGITICVSAACCLLTSFRALAADLVSTCSFRATGWCLSLVFFV